MTSPAYIFGTPALVVLRDRLVVPLALVLVTCICQVCRLPRRAWRL